MNIIYFIAGMAIASLIGIVWFKIYKINLLFDRTIGDLIQEMNRNSEMHSLELERNVDQILQTIYDIDNRLAKCETSSSKKHQLNG
jgi:K+/H+ antiporter YhaU regulatory subunit KhtT